MQWAMASYDFLYNFRDKDRGIESKREFGWSPHDATVGHSTIQ